MELVNQGFVRCGELIKAMTPGARLFAALSLALAIGSLVWLFGQHVVPGHTYLMGGESFSVTQLRDMESALGQAGLTDYQIDGARIRVPSGQQSKYMAALAEGGALPADFGEYLRKAVDTNGFMLYGSRQEAQLKVAVQSELQGLINNFHGIERSFVQIAEESNQGFSRTKSVTASVGVQPSTSESLNDRTVGAIRMIVANAWGGLKPENVTVVDLSSNRPFYGPLNSTGPGGGEYVENKKQIEVDWQEKVARVLGIAGAVVTSSVELESDGRTPRRVSIAVAVPAAHFATLWQQHHGLPPVAGRVRPDPAAVAAFERAESERIKQAIAPLLSSTDPAVDRTSLVAVSTIYAAAAPLPSTQRPEEVALNWLIANWQNVGLGVLVVVALLLMRSTFRSAAKPIAKSAIDELAESLYLVTDDAPVASPPGTARAAVSPPHSPSSAWQSELADRVHQDPQAAASVLRTWIGNSSNVRKAAILLERLDHDHAESLLRQMSPAQAHVLRQAVDGLGTCNAWEQDDVIEEFFRVAPLVPEPDAAGIELDAPLPAALSLGSPSSGLSGQGASLESSQASAVSPFRFLHEAPPRKLAPFLEREHPQTIAVVVSHLPADRAAEILAHLPGNLQIEVARRLVDLEETDPDVLREVERGLEAWLCSQNNGERRAASGVSALANILNAANPQARQHILSNLARHDRQLAEKLDGPAAAPLSFADLECMDSASLTVVLHHAENELLVLALAGAKPQFADRAIELLGTEAFAVRQALRNLGPTRMSDVEEAQRQLADMARQLEQRGEIVPDVRGRLSLAV